MTPELIRVLVAVHDEQCLKALRRILISESGYMTTEVAAARDALDTLQTGSFDVVLLELPQPDMADMVAVALLTSHSPRVPAVALADRDEEITALRAVQNGCVDYLLKGQLFATMVTRSIRYAVQASRESRRRVNAEEALRDSEERYRALFEQSRDAIYMTERNGEIVELNRAALELLGYEPGELVGRHVLEVYADPADRERFQQEIEARGSVRDFEVRLRRRDGTERWCLISGWVRRDGEGGEVEGYQGIIHDISARKAAEEQLAHEAFHDTLTGLPNRALFMDRLGRALARRRRGEERDLAVLFLDLDRFKVVNDSLGHAVGDALLRRMATLLAEEVREEDTLARLGGDEFAILLDGVDDAADATHVAERIQERLRDPFEVRGHDVFSSVSIGITFGGADAGTPEDLLRDADTAMYRAKELGPARYQIFDEAMHAHAVTLLQLETDLRLALERNEFVLHYQPVLSTHDRRLIGFEALVRWEHPNRGLLPPQTFIPVAEDTGLIVPLGEWVLRAACEQLQAWRRGDGDRDDLFVSVNLSVLQFRQPGLVSQVRDVLETTGLPGEALRLELTESVVMGAPEAASRKLRELRAMGVGLCIDDFGTGYSSLSYLHNFPIDTLKIDRSFVERMREDSPGDIVETIVALARNMGMAAVVEGIETEEQMRIVERLGPTSVQGFLFSTPLDREAVAALIADRLPAGG